MKLFKKVILPFAISSMLFLSACSSSNVTSTQSTSTETSSTVSAISEVSSATTALTEQSADISEQTTITTSEETSIVSSNPKPSNEKMYVHFIDVDQGDSIFIELPNNQTMLIDAAEDSQADKIITYIHQQGYDAV